MSSVTSQCHIASCLLQDDAAKQEEIKAHARQMIKEARAKTSQSIPRTGQGKVDQTISPLSSGTHL